MLLFIGGKKYIMRMRKCAQIGYGFGKKKRCVDK